MGGATYIVVSGDTLSSIANAHNTTVDAILAANPSITNPSTISLGDIITLPTATAAEG